MKTGLQVGLVLLAGGALMLSGGVAMAMPSAAPPAAHAECSVVQLPGMDVQLGEPGACVSVLLPPGSARNPTTQEPTSPVAATTAPEPVGDASPPTLVGDASPPAPVGDVSSPVPVGDVSSPVPVGDVSAPVPVGDVSAPVPVGDANLPYPCLDVNLPGIRISIGDASPPTQCVTAPTV
jgi:hypothetical protein